MANQYFQFKQFTVWHDQCAMKVGTDGVLLGSWADCSDAKLILDVGTGSGLIALMCAQRSNAHIDAIDISREAFNQATYNVLQSIFSQRINVYLTSYADFFPDKKYDLIVSNPPFFEKSLKSPDLNRSLARHNDSLSFESLIVKTVDLLSPEGKFAVIIPYDLFQVFDEIAYNNNLKLRQKTMVRPKPETPFKRVLAAYSVEEVGVDEKELVIEISRHVYSEGYFELTREFYL